ncbi:MAG: hypothetical protein ACRD1Z_06420 [Vicinamibacteria bacterium]
MRSHVKPYLLQPDFLEQLGVSRPTFDRYRRAGRLPPPPTAGKQAIYTREYLRQCQKMLRIQGLPRSLFSEAGRQGGRPPAKVSA